MYLPLSSVHAFKSMLNMNVSPVIEYFPVSPVAPPKRTTLYLFTMVMVCPNLACGTFLAMSRVSCAWLGSLSFPFSPLAPAGAPSFFLPSSADMAASCEPPLDWPRVTVNWFLPEAEAPWLELLGPLSCTTFGANYATCWLLFPFEEDPLPPVLFVFFEFFDGYIFNYNY